VVLFVVVLCVFAQCAAFVLGHRVFP
jgi:hypothetical protein